MYFFDISFEEEGDRPKFKELTGALHEEMLENVVEIKILLKNGITKTITKNSQIIITNNVLMVSKNIENEMSSDTFIFIDEIVSFSFNSFNSCKYCSNLCTEELETDICENFKLKKNKK